MIPPVTSYVCGVPEGALPEPSVYDFESSDYWREVDDAWEREKQSKCRVHYAWSCYACAAARECA